MIPAITGFPDKPLPTTAALLATNTQYWTLGNPAPVATKTGSTVSLSGRFNGVNVSGSGAQQTIGSIPVGYRPSSILEDLYATFYNNSGANQGKVTIQIQDTGLISLRSFAPSSSGYILFDPALTFSTN